MELTAAGVVHPGQEQSNFFEGYSNPRNKTLMRVFKDLGMVEYLGSGMPRILKAYPPESFIFSSRFIRTVFPINPAALELEKDISTEKGMTGKSSGKTVNQILCMLVAEPEKTIPAMADQLGISTRAVEKHLAILRRENRVVRVGGRKEGHWKVVVEDAP